MEKPEDNLIIIPREEWRWGMLCERGACRYAKKTSGYCPLHERRWLYRRQVWLWLTKPFRRMPEVTAKPPRSPRELGIYD